MKKMLGKLYWNLCKRIGYVIVFSNYYDPLTFTLKKKNSHMTLLKHIGNEDACGTIPVKQIFQIQIKNIQ